MLNQNETNGEGGGVEDEEELFQGPPSSPALRPKSVCEVLLKTKKVRKRRTNRFYKGKEI